MCSVLNLTRKVLPKMSAIPKNNIAAINSMPEMVLNRKLRDGAQNIVHCDMNQCAAAIISPNGIDTIYTDALAGCNAVNIITKLKDKRFLSILSHYVPTNIAGQLTAIEKQLQTYAPHIDKNYQPRTFLNIRGRNTYEGLEPVPNPIVDKLKCLLEKFFPQGNKIDITPYPTAKRPAFFSSANIFQFDPADTAKLKITSVGEKEKFIDLNI